MSLPFITLRVKPYPTISAMATGSTFLTTLENAQRFVPMFLHLEVMSLTGSIITSPSISLGTSSGATDILSATVPSLTLINGANKLYQVNILTNGSSIAPGADIWLNVGIAAIGPSAFTLRPDIIGYYI